MNPTRPPIHLLFCLAVGGCAASSVDDVADGSPEVFDGAGEVMTGQALSEPASLGDLMVTHRLPAAWVGEETTSSMRLAQYRIGGDPEVVCVVYWFGTGAGGSLQANLDRWTQQFAEGATIASEEFEIADGVRASLLDVRGTYVAEVTPGAAERHHETDWAMLAAYLEVPGGPLFLRLVGPSPEVVSQRAAFVAWIRSFRVVE